VRTETVSNMGGQYPALKWTWRWRDVVGSTDGDG
jgi:hypothetical protein